jgi:hypothetical protein
MATALDGLRHISSVFRYIGELARIELTEDVALQRQHVDLSSKQNLCLGIQDGGKLSTCKKSGIRAKNLQT